MGKREGSTNFTEVCITVELIKQIRNKSNPLVWNMGIPLDSAIWDEKSLPVKDEPEKQGIQ